MDIVSDYTNWRFDKSDLINTLVSKKSDILRRFSHIILITEYYYNEVVNNNLTLSSDEEVIFSTSFNYLYNHFNTIEIILDKYFNKNIEEMEKIAKTINLLIYTNDFQNELENNPKLDTLSNRKKLSNFEERIYKYIETHTNAPDEMFGLLDDITSSIFDEYNDVNSLLYEVALDLDLIKDNEETYQI